MSMDQFSGPRRSTRAPMPEVSTGNNGAKSRLADGVRSRPKSSNPTDTPKPKSPNTTPASSGSSGAKSRLADGARSRPKSPNPPDSPKPKSPNANPASSGSSDVGGKGKGNEDEKPTKDKEGASGNGQNDDGNEKGSPENKGGSSGPSPGNAGSKMKRPGSDATGVDYSDKGMKDQLEHQAADVAMDATPGLAQFNSARKALKNYNKAKNDAGGKGDGITDKLEEAADDVVDKGIKGAKFTLGTAAAGQAGQIGMYGLMLIQMLKMVKGMALAALGKIAGFFSSVFNGIGSFFSGVLGVTTAVGNAIAAGVTAVVVGTTSVLGVGVVQELKKDDSMLDCIPIQTKVPTSSQLPIDIGEIEAVREDNAVKLWSVYSVIGGSKEQTAAVLGNLQTESSLDPTAVETIYTEPFTIGERKQSAIASDFKVGLIDAAYGARFPAIEYVGIGLAQWTNGRNRLLVDYAEEKGVNWYEFDTQVRFMLDGDDPMRQTQLTDFLHSAPGNTQAETERFMNTWIGLSTPNPSLGDRQSNAMDYMFILERATADTNYADSILSGINVDRSQGNHSAGAYHQDDGCGKPIKAHYRNQAPDGTGEVPSGLALVPWSRETLPDSLREFAKNPEEAGLAWGNATGWADGIYPNQCVALATSYFMRLYPDWNRDGRAATRPFGDGKDTADGWASHYGQRAVDYPSSGAVFSDTTTSVWGHTGIVQHVFANGDILIAEQNIRGISGEGAGLNYSWSWRVIKKERYEQENWKFFKPVDAEPQWVQNAV